jgi:hypothetical protein
MHPRTDMADEKSEIFGAEFPSYNLICGRFNTLLGYSHAHGRMIRLIFSSLAVWCFYLSLKYFESEQTAFSAAITLSVSIWFSFSRKIMPDVLSFSLVLMAVYWMHKYIRSHNSLLLILAGILASLAIFLAGIWIFLNGTFVLFKNKDWVPIGVFVSFWGVLGLFIHKTGAVFPLHNYYIIPFVPVMAWLCVKGIGMLPKKAIIISLVLISAESILNQQHDFFIKDPEWHTIRLEPIAALHINRHDLWVMSGGPSPQHLYFADRRG